eukprot:gnl/TRDRNA2_/TRDRNA2_200013_c0_seq1.p1 gnl/TRDRNA2_/TRDRNA2_200013_c0~~gnl/TRDRNA2_/TRDRNA2_200013_c0_seq1.p1  ORF type:complete len:269 (+),score=41.86 gnl/TRDRNA2_/TRDRNA2_200013_c0_seq1:48-809(+)
MSAPMLLHQPMGFGEASARSSLRWQPSIRATSPIPHMPSRTYVVPSPQYSSVLAPQSPSAGLILKDGKVPLRRDSLLSPRSSSPPNGMRSSSPPVRSPCLMPSQRLTTSKATVSRPQLWSPALMSHTRHAVTVSASPGPGSMLVAASEASAARVAGAPTTAPAAADDGATLELALQQAVTSGAEIGALELGIEQGFLPLREELRELIRSMASRTDQLEVRVSSVQEALTQRIEVLEGRFDTILRNGGAPFGDR